MTFQGGNAIAIGSKLIYKNQLKHTTFGIQCWLLALTILLWMFAFVYAKINEKRYENIIDFQTASAYDYTLIYNNVPID